MSASKTSTAALRTEGVDLARMRRPPSHPGEIFEHEYRIPSRVSQAEAARRIGMSMNGLNRIVKGTRAVTADTALRFGLLTGTDPRFWLRLQAEVDLWHALRAMKGDVKPLAETA